MAKVKTSDKILQCATEMFAAKGFEGTIMDEMADVCGVNKATIYYHFKDKATLYETAITDLIAKTVDAVEEAVDKEKGYPDKLKVFIQTFARYANEHSAFPAVIMREIAAGGSNMPLKVRQQMLRLLSFLKDLLQGGIEAGEFNPIDHMIAHFMIIGSINFYVLSQPLRSMMEVDDPNIEQTIKHNNIDAAAAEVSRIICKAVKKENH